MNKLYLILSVIIISFNNLLAQSQHDLGSWNVINIKYNHSKKLSIFGEGQLRSLQFYNHFHYYEYKGGINYKIHPTVKLTLGAGSYQTFKEGGSFVTPKNNNEFRLWPQIIFFQEIQKFKIEQRYRTELRWTSKGYRNRFRYRFAISYPFGKDTKGYKPFQVSFSNELFFTDKQPYFERNRVQLALNYKTTKHTSIQFGYLHQFDYKINDEIGRDFLLLGIYYELNRKQNSKLEQETELKDN
jgi:hypothetical protein